MPHHQHSVSVNSEIFFQFNDSMFLRTAAFRIRSAVRQLTPTSGGHTFPFSTLWFWVSLGVLALATFKKIVSL